MDALTAVLKPKYDILSSICDKCYKEFSFTFYINVVSDENAPEIHLTNEQNQFISSLNAECDFDVILLSDKEPEREEKEVDW